MLLADIWATDEGASRVVRWRMNEPSAAEDFRIEVRSTRGVRFLENVLPVSDREFAVRDDGLDGDAGGEIEYTLWYRSDSGAWGLLDAVTAVRSALPALTAVVGSYPNPFNPKVRIELDVDRRRMVVVAVHDLRGRRVAELAARAFTAGRHAVEWDGRDARGHDVAAGVYLVRSSTATGTSSLKIVLAR